MMVPEQTTFNMVRFGWHLMNRFIWYRGPENVRKPNKERLLINDWEYLYWFAKDHEKYYFNDNCGMDKTSVLEFPSAPPNKEKFDSGYPIELVNIAVDSTAPPNATILDPFMGTAVTGVAALRKNRYFIGIDIDPVQTRLAKEKLERI